ncbi:MAG: colanic acid/amylovoran biosynthesis glycosyltransferase, partial [Actinomycetota bacterium]|nr:colanic acid/amylovoran biosynthesis glycosyltransferase [Actinomycetota bacterium]
MKARVLYVVSRFPKVTETFVVNEWAALTPRFDMYFAALIHTDEPALHPATRTALREAWFVPRAAPSTFRTHLTWLRRAPRRYAGALRDVVRGARDVSPAELVKSLVAFHQAARLALLADDAGIDHVHAHFANHPATAAWVVHRLTGIPFSFTAHANDLFRNPLQLERKVRAARFVVAISDYNRRILEHRCPGATVHVVHCGVDTNRFTVVAQPDGGRNARRHVLCVAGIEPKKGHADLVAAFATIASTFDDVDLVLIGDGPERDNVARQVRAAGIGARVEFLGARSTDDVRTELARADLFVLPSVRDETGRMDGIPVALMEAMAS